MRCRPLPLAALALALLCPPSFAQGLGPRALLRVRADFSQAGHGLRLLNQDLFVAADRSVQANLVANATHVSLQNYWQTRRFSGVAPPAAFAELGRALAEARIGTLDGERCTVVVSTRPVFGAYDVTWYGIGQRRAQLLIDLNGGFSPLCPPELAALVNAVNRFARDAGIAEFGH